MREKYIEEVSEMIAKSACPIYRENCDEYQPHTCTECVIWSTPIGCLAEDLYNAGYRKQSEIIDEFAERIKKHFANYPEPASWLEITEEGFCKEVDELVAKMKDCAE